MSVWLLGYLCHYGNEQGLRTPHVSTVTPSRDKSLCAPTFSQGGVLGDSSSTRKASAFCNHKVTDSSSQTFDDSQDLKDHTQDSSAHQHFIPYHNYTNFLDLLGKLHKTEQNLKLTVGTVSVYCSLILKYSHMQLKTPEAKGVALW